MRFVETKTLEQQSCLMLHRTRNLIIRQLNAITNALRAHLAEFGIVAPVGRRGIEELLEIVADASDQRVPEVARACLAALGEQLRVLKAHVLKFDRLITVWHRSNETSGRLDALPGVGPALATALVASVGDPKAFRSGRHFSAWIGLVPRQSSSGGKQRLDQQARRSLSAQPIHSRRASRNPLREDPRRRTSALAHRIVGMAVHEGRRRRTRQQDSQNGMGHDGQGRALQRTGRTCSVNAIAPHLGVM